MKLYNLALKANNFSCSGTIKTIFGVPKDYYQFMKKYNITYRLFKILQLLKEKDINNVRYLEKFVNYGDNTYD